jgi:non-specific serine/threonine protein kinase
LRHAHPEADATGGRDANDGASMDVDEAHALVASGRLARCFAVTTLALSPAGKLVIDAHDGEPAHPAAKRVAAAFDAGSGAGLLHLATTELGAELPASLSFGREIGAQFLTKLCAQPDEIRANADVPMPVEDLRTLLDRAPPMRGGERLSLDALSDAWLAMQAHVVSTPAFLRGLGPPWHVVGRVCFHLAENKADAHAPFAFLATYAAGVGAGGRARRAPLGRALGDSATDKRMLRALLEPVQRAAEKSAFVNGLVERGEIFHPIAWTPDEAYAFMRDVPTLEQAGVVVRVPDWWRSRPQVTVTVGSKQAAGFGVDALLDFDMAVSLGGDALTQAELKELLQDGGAGLRFFKGRWVEVDAEKLQQALAQWQQVAATARTDGVSFLEGMRLLARAPGSISDRADDEASHVIAGAWLRDVIARLQEPKAASRAVPDDALKGTLRPYQRDGVAWLHHAASLGLGACLADDMGLGKTIQVLSLFLILKRESLGAPHLLVVPASLLANWRAEAARFAPSLSLVVAHPSEMPPAALAALATDGVDVVLTTYGTLMRTASLAERRFGLVVLDEAQAIKNPGAKQTRAVKALRCASRIALTGTPVENRLGDLWSLFDFLNPGLLGTAKSFSDAARKMESDKGRGFAPLRTLIKPYILRRMKTDKRVIDDLPEKTEMRAFCGLTKRQAALYADVVSALDKDLQSADGMKRRGIVLASIMRLKQICNHPSQFLGDGVFESDDSGKLARLAELCEPIVARQEKMLCFTQFKEMTAPLHVFLAEVFGGNGFVLHGEVAVKKRAALVADFQRDDGPPFFVLSLKAGGTGLNLTAAAHVVHFDRWWNPAVEDQATDRAFRIGQKKNVMVHKLVCRGTLEEKIDAMLVGKRALSDELLGESGEAWLTEMSTQELMRVVSLDLSKAMQEA